MAVKRNLMSSAFIFLLILAGVAFLLSAIFGKTKEEIRQENDLAEKRKELGVSNGGLDPKVASKKLTESIDSAVADKARKDALNKEEKDKADREAAQKALDAARRNGGGGGATVGANGYPAGTPNGGNAALGVAGSGMSGTAVQNLNADEQARLAREIEAATQLASLRGAKTAAFEDGTVAMGSTQLSNQLVNKPSMLGDLPSVEQVMRMADAGTGSAGRSGAANGPNNAMDATRDALRAQMMNAGQPAAEPSTAQRNANFLKEVAAAGSKNERDKATAGSMPRAPLSKHMLLEGWRIPAVLATAVNSDLGGDISAIVSQRVYDSVSGSVCLIPQGSKLVGKYNSEVLPGQERLLFAFTGLYYPNGTYVPLGSFNGSDAAGASGVGGNVNNHFWKIFGSSMVIGTVSTVASAFASRGTSQGVAVNIGSSVAGNSASALSDVTKKMLERNTNIKPTISLKIGEKFSVVVAHELVLSPQTTNVNCN